MSARLLTADLVLAVSNGVARYLLESHNPAGDVRASMPVTVAELEVAVLAQMQTLIAMSDDPKATLERLNSGVVSAVEGDFADAY